MNADNYKIAQQLKEELSQHVDLVDLTVYGSRARGDADADSDMDVLVQVTTLDSTIRETIRNIVWRVGFEHFCVISALIVSIDEMTNTPLRSSPLMYNIREQGVHIQ